MAFTQANRSMRVATPLGPDKLLLVEFSGTETLSELFQFHLTLLAENATKVEFDKLIGQPIAVEIDMPDKKKRLFNGICSQLSEGRRDDTFTHYKMEVVPLLWLFTRRIQSRIFQQITVPDILKQVLKGIDVKWDIQGKFFERDYCVQYRESDFAFASRLMEEEGVYYYFNHSTKVHTLVVANTPQGHVDTPDFAKAIYERMLGGNREDMRVTEWEKVQKLRSGKVTLWDNCFELPQQQLEAQKTITESVPVGKVTHKLKVADNDKLEIYDYPGSYAQRFDGVDPGGGDRAGDLKKIFEDNARVAKLQIEQEATESLLIRGAGNCRQFSAGHKFTLASHFNADGQYVLTSVSHTAKLAADYRSGQGEVLTYVNSFTCIPLALPFRPQRKTHRPTVAGTQTATVVGPGSEIITCDKYGRVKVQFHWDRHGKKDASSSCWVRVSQNWGGAGWGGMFIPHHGQEVIVDFEEGDPDRPLIIGRVYNAETMPPLALPDSKTQSAIRDHGGNEIIMQGHGGVQQIKILSPEFRTIVTMGAARNPPEGFSVDTDHHAYFIIKQNVNWDVDGDAEEDIQGSETIRVHGHHKHTTTFTSHEYVGGLKMVNVGGAMNELVVISRSEQTGGFRNELTGKKKTERVIGKSSLTVHGNYTVTAKSDHTLNVTGEQQTTIGKKHTLHSGALEHKVKGNLTEVVDGGDYASKATGTVGIEAEGGTLTLKCGGASIVLENGGTITLKGTDIVVDGSSSAKIGAGSGALEMSGTSFKLGASAGGEVSAGATLDLKGTAMVNINN